MQLLRAGKALRKNVVLVMLISNKDRKYKWGRENCQKNAKARFRSKKDCSVHVLG